MHACMRLAAVARAGIGAHAHACARGQPLSDPTVTAHRWAQAQTPPPRRRRRRRRRPTRRRRARPAHPCTRGVAWRGVAWGGAWGIRVRLQQQPYNLFHRRVRHCKLVPTSLPTGGDSTHAFTHPHAHAHAPMHTHTHTHTRTRTRTRTAARSCRRPWRR